MNIIRLEPDEGGTAAWPTLSTSRKSVVTVGVFDGVHRGHQAVIGRTVELARAQDCFAVVIMFDPRPAFVHMYAKTHAGIAVPEGLHDAQALTGTDMVDKLIPYAGKKQAIVDRIEKLSGYDDEDDYEDTVKN